MNFIPHSKILHTPIALKIIFTKKLSSFGKVEFYIGWIWIQFYKDISNFLIFTENRIESKLKIWTNHHTTGLVFKQYSYISHLSIFPSPFVSALAIRFMKFYLTSFFLKGVFVFDIYFLNQFLSSALSRTLLLFLSYLEKILSV